MPVGDFLQCIIDTYIWVEYLSGSECGRKLSSLFEKEGYEFITPFCVLSELKTWAIKEKFDYEKILAVVRANSHLEPVEFEEWLDAADIKSEMRKSRPDFGLVDSLLVAKQRRYGCGIVSGDEHLRGLKGVIFIK